MNDKLRWVLPAPLLIFGLGVWLYFHTENEVRVQMERAQEHWRLGRYAQAIDLYRNVYLNYPESQYADNALWETATIYHVNFYDVDRTLLHLHELVGKYPESSLVSRAYLRIAEIHETELGDLDQALNYLDQLLKKNGSSDLDRQILLKMGDVLFKQNNFSDALNKFNLLLNTGGEDHLAEQARIRVGTILQIQHRYEESLSYFDNVLERTTCGDCRLAARLGLIESYEFLGKLREAIQVARGIPVSEFPSKRKEELVERLENKAGHYPFSDEIKRP